MVYFICLLFFLYLKYTASVYFIFLVSLQLKYQQPLLPRILQHQNQVTQNE